MVFLLPPFSLLEHDICLGLLQLVYDHETTSINKGKENPKDGETGFITLGILYLPYLWTYVRNRDSYLFKTFKSGFILPEVQHSLHFF